MLAFGCAVTDDELYERCALPGIELAREPEPDTPILTFGSCGSVFRSYNLLLDKAKEHGGLEGFVILHQDAEIIDPDFLREGPDGAQRPGRRPRRLRGRRRRSQHRLVGGVGHVGVVHASLRGVRRRRASGADVAPGQDPRLRRDRRGRHDRRLRDGLLAVGDREPPLRRDDRRRAARLRLRHLHAGPRRRKEGRDGGPARHPPPLAGPHPGRRRVDGGPHQARREVARLASGPDPGLATPGSHGRGPGRRGPAGSRRERADLRVADGRPRGRDGPDRGQPELADHARRSAGSPASCAAENRSA